MQPLRQRPPATTTTTAYLCVVRGGVDGVVAVADGREQEGDDARHAHHLWCSAGRAAGAAGHRGSRGRWGRGREARAEGQVAGRQGRAAGARRRQGEGGRQQSDRLQQGAGRVTMQLGGGSRSDTMGGIGSGGTAGQGGRLPAAEPRCAHHRTATATAAATATTTAHLCQQVGHVAAAHDEGNLVGGGVVRGGRRAPDSVPAAALAVGGRRLLESLEQQSETPTPMSSEPSESTQKRRKTAAAGAGGAGAEAGHERISEE